jgi:hypothetical protein
MQKLVENFKVSSSEITSLVKINESLSQIEKDGKTFRCIAAYTFPLSRPDLKNLNGRIYTTSLWNNILSKRLGFGRYGLCDHPSENSDQPDGSVKDAFCVWHNLRLGMNEKGEKLFFGDCYLFGTWGQHCKDAIDAGGEIGLSTVGYGEFLPDGITIDPESYELDRPADWVLNPSYEVYGRAGDEILSSESTNKAINGTVVESSEPTSEKENEMKDKIQALEEKSFRLQMTSQMTEADKESSPAIRLSRYNELMEFFADGLAEDLRTSLKGKIESTNKQILDLAEKGASVDLLTDSNKELSGKLKEFESNQTLLENRTQELNYVKENYEKTLVLCDSLKSYSETLKEMYDLKCSELETRISASEYKELQAYSESLEAELAELKHKHSLAVIEASKKEDDDDKDDKEDEPFGGKKAPPFKKGNKAGGDGDGKDDKDDNPDGKPDKDEKKKKESDDDGEDEDDKDDDDEKDEKKKKESSVVPAILNYYVDLVSINPKVKDIKEDILSCRTLLEAQTTYMRLRSLVDNRQSLYHTSTARPQVSPSVKFTGNGGFATREEAEDERPLNIRKGWK